MSNDNYTFPVKQVVYPDGRVLLVDYVDDDFLLDRWQLTSLGYAVRSPNQWDRDDYDRKVHRKRFVLHRLIMRRVLNRPLEKHEEVDHVNGNPLDNRRCNLRLATRTENARNTKRSKANTTGFKGVYLNKVTGRYRAIITVNKKQIYLGCYDDPRDAHKAYCEAAILHFGVFARFE